MAESRGVVNPPGDWGEGTENARETADNNRYYEMLLRQLESMGVSARPNAVNPLMRPQELESLRDSMQRLGQFDFSGYGKGDTGTTVKTPEQSRSYYEDMYRRAVPEMQNIFDLYKGRFLSSNWMSPDKSKTIQRPGVGPVFDPSKAGEEAGGKPMNWGDITGPTGTTPWFEAFMPKSLQDFLKPYVQFGQSANPGLNPWDIWNPLKQPKGIPW